MVVDLRGLGKKLSLPKSTNPPSQNIAAVGTPSQRSGWRRTPLVPWAIAAITTVFALAVGMLHFRQAPPEEPVNKVVRFSLIPDEPPSMPAVSPDGQHIAYTAGPGRGRLWIWDLARERARELEGTDGASFPFWSPDTADIGFFVGRELKKISPHGGLAATLCSVPTQFRLAGC
jgi:hypothetical protein